MIAVRSRRKRCVIRVDLDRVVRTESSMMAEEQIDGPTEKERLLCELIGRYCDAVADGQAPDRRALIDQHPKLARSLRRFFGEQDRLRRSTVPSFDSKAPGPVVDRTETVTPPADRNEGGDAATALSTDDSGRGGLAAGDTVGYFGDYELLGEIARGGMGVVYRARQAQP